MTYITPQPTALITVAETAPFIRQAAKLWSQEDRDAFVLFIATNPDAGDVIPDTGGLRKVRWTRPGTGKRGGVRIIYFYHDDSMSLYLLPIFAKAERENWTWDEKRRAEAMTGSIKQIYRGTDTMTKFGEALLESLDDALAHASGEPSGVQIRTVPLPDVRAIRRKLNMSQQVFAETYRIPLPTLKNWEQGRRHPDAPAIAYLLTISRLPAEVSAALAQDP